MLPSMSPTQMWVPMSFQVHFSAAQGKRYLSFCRMAGPQAPLATSKTRRSPSQAVAAKTFCMLVAQAMLEKASPNAPTYWSGFTSFLQSSWEPPLKKLIYKLWLYKIKKCSNNEGDQLQQKSISEVELPFPRVFAYRGNKAAVWGWWAVYCLMSKYLLLSLLVWLACPVRIFLFGSILMYDNNPAYKRLALETGKPVRPEACQFDWQVTDCPKVAVITSACPDSDCGEEEYNIGDDEEAPTGPFFWKLGMVPRHVTVHVDNYEVAADPFTEEGQRNLEIISQADVIYFNGGDQSRHMRSWFNDDGTPNPLFSVLRNRVLKDDVIVVGVSAGTAVNSKIIYGGGSSFGILYFSNSVGLAPNSVANGAGLDDLRNGTDCLQYEENGAKLDGFGFVTDFQIDTHFDRRGRLGRLIPVLTELKTPIGVGIDEQACFFYKDGVGTVYGNNGVFIADITDAYKITSKYFQMRNIRVHYLTEGDTFNIKTRQLTTTKPAISAPSFTGYVDSKNILSKYECTRLITRLVDQRGLFNLGKTTTPEDEDYPAETPRFDLIFYKEEETKGYKQNGRYTVANAYIDLTAEVRNI